MFMIAWKSVRNRLSTVLLAILSIAMSVSLILTVEKVRRDARSGFTQTVSGTDLIVGARSGEIQLLLYSVFHIGNATNNISWESAQDIAARSGVDWMIPLSLGDSHKGYRVVGTNKAFFEHFRYGKDRELQLQKGLEFESVLDAVIGSEVADKLGYKVGQKIVVAHGIGKAGLVEHDKSPFTVSGILKRTGTPIDKALHISLEGIEAMHMDWRNGEMPTTKTNTVDGIDLQPKAVTALLIGLRSRASVFREQRAINTYKDEPLLAILPGVALQQLWGMMGIAESALFIVSVCVVVVALISLVSVLLAGLNERRREMAILRALGSRPGHVFILLCLESGLLTFIGVVLGIAIHSIAIVIGSQWIEDQFGIALTLSFIDSNALLIVLMIAVAGLLAGVIPGFSAYRKSLSDGMAQKF